jgi:hypothetical protein
MGKVSSKSSHKAGNIKTTKKQLNRVVQKNCGNRKRSETSTSRPTMAQKPHTQSLIYNNSNWNISNMLTDSKNTKKY